jgi:hypothetical protein
MTKFTINDTPSEQVRALAEEVTVTDSDGKRIGLKKPGVLAQFRMVKAMGADASNEIYAQMVMPLIFVTSIDDEPVLMPQNTLQIEALIARLDNSGIEAVMTGVRDNFATVSEEEAKAQLRK